MLDFRNWGVFILDDLFEIKSSKKIFHAVNLEIIEKKEKGYFPYITRKSINNGIKGYIKENEKFLNPGNNLSLAQDTFTAYYQESDFFTGNKIKILMPRKEIFKDKFTKNIAFFIITSFNIELSNYNWGTSSNIEKIKKFEIRLPVYDNGEINFLYMEEYIKNLETKISIDLEKLKSVLI